jgi:hypothetical protein
MVQLNFRFRNSFLNALRESESCLRFESRIWHVRIPTFLARKTNSLCGIHASSVSHETGCQLLDKLIKISSFSYALGRRLVGQGLRLVKVRSTEDKYM